MIKIIGNDVRRGMDKIGYVQGNDIHDHEGHKVGYFADNHIYDASGRKVARLQGDAIFDAQGGVVAKVSENNESVSGGAHSDLSRAAIRVLLGD